MPNKIIAVMNDLMFTVRISDAAKRVGVAVQFVKTSEDALRTAKGAEAVILDLNFTPGDLIARLKSTEETRGVRLIGFVSHVDEAIIRQARESGCDTVMARSAFVKNLDQLLQAFS